MSQIICSDVTLGYDNKIVLENLNFSVNTGDYLCIVGENGSGKSTVIKALIGLIKAICGKIEISSAKIGYLPQQSLIPKDFPATVREIVLSGCSDCKKLWFSNSRTETAKKNMELMNVSDLADKSFAKLSGGQQQRVLLARALCAASDILLLDEPTSSLDSIATAELYNTISRLNKEKAMTIIMVSHDISSVLGYATHILHIGNSEIFFGTTNEYLKSPIAKGFSDVGGQKND